MIEFLNKKRMIFIVIFLAVVTILILILEEALTKDEKENITFTASIKDFPYYNISHQQHFEKVKEHEIKINNNTPKVFTTIDLKDCKEIRACSPCSEFEINSKTPEACISTGFKVTLDCDKKGIVYKSCSRIQDVEWRNFLVFEALMLLLTIVSYGFVQLRTSQLERIAARKAERRLAQSY